VRAPPLISQPTSRLIYGCCLRYEREESASPPVPLSPVGLGFGLQVQTVFQFIFI
jgi:hypothetical protein